VGMEGMSVAREVQATWEPPSAVVALRSGSFFRFLTDDDLTRLARIGVRRSYAAGDQMVEEGSDRGGLFVILSGTAQVDAGGAVHTLGPGDFFGEMALLARSRRTATVFAVESVEVMIIETIDYRAFLIENPSVAVTLLEGVAGRLAAAQTSHETNRT
jgi:CRP-like cAMP-binding protein